MIFDNIVVFINMFGLFLCLSVLLAKLAFLHYLRPSRYTRKTKMYYRWYYISNTERFRYIRKNEVFLFMQTKWILYTFNILIYSSFIFTLVIKLLFFVLNKV